jgi:hypothetical protein
MRSAVLCVLLVVTALFARLDVSDTETEDWEPSSADADGASTTLGSWRAGLTPQSQADVLLSAYSETLGLWKACKVGLKDLQAGASQVRDKFLSLMNEIGNPPRTAIFVGALEFLSRRDDARASRYAGARFRALAGGLFAVLGSPAGVSGAGSDAGKAARCSTVKTATDFPAGDLDCSNIFDTTCYAPTGWQSTSATNSVCTNYWTNSAGTSIAGTVNQCPDGGIGWEGVSVYVGTGVGVNNWNWCAAWNSDHALMGLASCTGDRKVCTKIFAGHIHGMGARGGILAMKRMVCDADWNCKVYKSGKCFHTSSDVFTSRYHSQNGNNMDAGTLYTKNKAWATSIVADLKAGTATACGDAACTHADCADDETYAKANIRSF